MGLLDRWLKRFMGDGEETADVAAAERPEDQWGTADDDAQGPSPGTEPTFTAGPTTVDRDHLDPLDALVERVRRKLTTDREGRRYAEGDEFLSNLRALDEGGRSRASDGLLTDALLVTPSRALRRRLAERLLHRGEREEAKLLLEDLMHEEEHAAWALTALGQIAENDGDIDEALLMYERVLAIDITLEQPKARARRLRASQDERQASARKARSALTRFLGARAAGARYAVLEEIGRGGAATVFRARDRVVDREVALKIFHPRGRAEDRRARLLQEARIAGAFDHPHIVPILDVDSGRDLLVMMLCDEGTLRQRLGQGRISVTKSAEFGAILLRTLADVHDTGRAHLDVKPSNVLIHQGRSMLCDFGTAGLVEMGAAAGTRAYMAPEQRARGVAGPAADLYAAGLVVFECLTGHLPTGVERGRPEIVLPELAEGPQGRALAALIAELCHEDPEVRLKDGRVAAQRLLEAAALPALDKEGLPLVSHLEMLARREGEEAQARLAAHPLFKALRPEA